MIAISLFKLFKLFAVLPINGELETLAISPDVVTVCVVYIVPYQMLPIIPFHRVLGFQTGRTHPKKNFLYPELESRLLQRDCIKTKFINVWNWNLYVMHPTNLLNYELFAGIVHPGLQISIWSCDDLYQKQ